MTRGKTTRRGAAVLAAALVGALVGAPARAQTSPPATEPDAAAPQEPETAAADGASSSGPWRAEDALGSPEWLHVGLEHRTRYAYLFDQFRAGRPGDGGLMSLRTNFLGELRFAPVRVGAELLDSRAYLESDVTAPNTGIVNALSLLQAYVALDGEDALAPGDAIGLRVGRITMDVGSRRLSARNNFRNTINGFTGIDARYRAAEGPEIRLFATMPIERLPDESDAVASNDVAFDHESPDVIFAGQWIAAPLGARVQLEAYAFQLHERDGEGRNTRNRRLVTPGLRAHRDPRPGALDFDAETIAQMGRSRASASPDDLQDLHHLAFFQHASLGYTFDVPLTPRVMVEYDHATGDGDPRDDSNRRFDTLYGARRFDFGPTGIYGALARSNIRSPGLRVQLKPHRTLRGFLGWRAVWLDQARDSWTTSGLRDVTGQSGRYVGQQIEGRVRYDPLIDNLRFELGFAHLFAGRFAEEAPGANEDTDTTMIYGQVTVKL